MTSTRAYCDLCGDDSYWGRFGSLKAVYERGSKYSNPYERIAWLCPSCLQILAKGYAKRTELENQYLNAIAEGRVITREKIDRELRDIANREEIARRRKAEEERAKRS